MPAISTRLTRVVAYIGDAIGTNDLESAATLLGLALIMVVTYGVALVVR